MKEIKIPFNGYDIVTHVFDDLGSEKKGVVQIVHGIAEHSLRYRDFAEYLNKLGYVVYASDHPGHGKTASKFGVVENDAMDTILESLKSVYGRIKTDYKDCDVILFGHSMGSFLSLRTVEIRREDYRALILSGTDGPKNPILTFAVKPLSSLLKMLGQNSDEKDNLGKLAFGAFNKTFEGRTQHDWINSIPEEVDNYGNDPMCGFDAPNRFILSLMRNMPQWYRDTEISKIRKSLPILIIAGDKDPVGEFGKGPKRLLNQLEKHGVNNAVLKLYKDARHEILLERKKDEVYEDISAFLNDYI